MNADWIVPAFAVFLIFGGGGMVKSVVANMNKTRIALAKIKAQQNNGVSAPEIAALRQEVTALRQEIHALRDTSTQYDMSFDTALQRVEQRISRVEQKQVEQISLEAPQQQKVGY